MKRNKGGITISDETITMAGGGNEFPSELIYLIPANGTLGVTLSDVSLAADCVVNLHISYDEINYVALVDALGDAVTGTLAAGGDPLTFSVNAIPKGGLIKVEFETDTTGDVKVVARY